jgi:hypothetical protein
MTRIKGSCAIGLSRVPQHQPPRRRASLHGVLHRQDEAQRSLASLAQRALRGEPVLIQIEGSPQLLSLQSVDAELPEGYLADCSSRSDVRPFGAVQFVWRLPSARAFCD